MPWSVYTPKGHRLDSRSRAWTKVAGSILSLVGADSGGYQLMCLSHIYVSLRSGFSHTHTINLRKMYSETIKITRKLNLSRYFSMRFKTPSVIEITVFP